MINTNNIERITSKDLIRLSYIHGIKNSFIPSEHWWNKAEKWFFVVFNRNNPLTYGSVNPELKLIWDSKEDLVNYLKNCKLIFYGWGAGETETALIDSLLEKNDNIEVIAVDVNEDFINMFNHSMNLLKKENHKIEYKGYIGRFQELKSNHLDFNNSRFKNKNHIILGNLVANMEEEIIKVISNLSEENNYLTIGFNTPKHINIILDKIKESKYFNNFVISEEDSKKNIKWSIKNNTLIAEYDGIMRFTSKLYNPEELENICLKYRLKKVYEKLDENRHSCIQIYQKLN